MNIFLIGLTIFNGIILWMINKWALNNNARTNVMGMINGIAGLGILLILYIFGFEFVMDKTSIIIGVIQGITYVIAFCVFILYSLKIGPTGLTATMNNLGLIFPVLAEIFIFKTAGLTNLKYIALAAVVITFILLLIDSYLIKDKNITKKWLFFVFLGWIFAGTSMTTQTIASNYNCDPNTYTLFAIITIFVLMSIICLIKEKGRPTKYEYISGAFNGYNYVSILIIAQVILETIPANVYFPISVATPIVIVMILNHFVFKEKSSTMAWIAASFGIVGIVLLSI